MPLLFLVLLEGVLRILNFGYPASFFVALDRGTLTTNPKFAWQFHSRQTASPPTPVLLKKDKPAGTKRVFVLGESAAAGTPDAAFSFSRMLELMLEQEFPTNRVEIINAAMRGIDSHIIRQIAAECARLSPDLFIVYMGNNEMIGLHSPEPGALNWFKRPAFIRLEHAIKRAKTGQLLESGLRRAAIVPAKPRHQDMAFMRNQRLAFDDPSREIVYRNYRSNLESICKTAARAGAKTIVCSVAVNLHDLPPLQSMHRGELSPGQLDEWNKLYALGSEAEAGRDFGTALKQFRAAAHVDDHHAELLYRLARSAEAIGNIEEARRHYSAARDWDALQFRTDSRINSIAREASARGGTNQIRFVDVEKALAASPLSVNSIPGEALFQEHVHFTFAGDHEVASTLFPQVSAALGFIVREAVPLTRQECARRLAYTKIEEANILSAVAQMTGKAPFLDQLEHSSRQARAEARAREAMLSLTTNDLAEAESTYRAALDRRPDDWMLHYNHGRFFTETGRHADSIAEFERVAKLFPQQCRFRLSLGMALLQAQRDADGVSELNAALKIDPEFTPARQALAKLAARLH